MHNDYGLGNAFGDKNKTKIADVLNNTLLDGDVRADLFALTSETPLVVE